jgi:alcohol dehydrogenase, propanol-preferring
MQKMVLRAPHRPLTLEEGEDLEPQADEVIVAVKTCGVCRTDLHVVDGELPHPKLPLVPGHEITGVVSHVGAAVSRFSVGDRVGVPWLGFTCGGCDYCRRGQENLCDRAEFTGYTRDGGYAQQARADERYCFLLPPGIDDLHAAPLLCAGLIGFRALRFALEAEHLGLYGFGAAAHLVAQVALQQGRRVYAFVRPGDDSALFFARELGVTWAGASGETPPHELDAALIFAPVGALVPAALRVVRKGGRVVCAGIHMSDIPAFPYSVLWGERSIHSVANLTRQDGDLFLDHVARYGIHTTVTEYALTDANRALSDLRDGGLRGAAVLRVG